MKRTIITLLLIPLLSVGMLGCASTKKAAQSFKDKFSSDKSLKERIDAERPDQSNVDPEIAEYLNNHKGKLRVDEAVFYFGSPSFFTQQGEVRVGIWQSVERKTDYGRVIGNVDPVGAYGLLKDIFKVKNDTGWELRMVFGKDDKLVDWVYFEW